MPGAVPNRNTVGSNSGNGIETTRDNEFIAGANNRLNFNIAKRQFDPGVAKPTKVLPLREIVARAANPKVHAGGAKRANIFYVNGRGFGNGGTMPSSQPGHSRWHHHRPA